LRSEEEGKEVQGVGRGVALAATLVLAGLYIACFGATFLGMVPKWYTEDYSYAWLLPAVIAYLLWEKRGELAKTALRPWWPALALLALTMATSLYSLLGSDLSGARISAWLMLVGTVLLCFGPHLTRALALPLVLAGFMIPLPNTVQGPLTSGFKLAASQIAALMMRSAGVSVFVDGNVIDLGTNKLQVVDACSGLRYFFPLIALGLICAHFLQRRRWKQAVLVASTLPISVVSNGARVGLTGILSEYWDPKVAEGFFHGFSGWLLFVVAFAALLAINRLLNLGGAGPEQVAEPPGGGEVSRRFSLAAFGAAAGVLAVVLGFSLSIKALPPLRLPAGIGGFPLAFSGWQGVSQPVEPEIVAKSGAEESFSACYSGGPAPVDLYLGWRGSPFLESEEFFHSPTVCLPSGGWTVLEQRVRAVSGAHPRFRDFRVREMVVEKLGRRQLVYFWFQTRDRVAWTITLNRYHLALAALRRQNTYDVFVRLITPLEEGGREAAEARLDAFVRQLEPVMLDYLGQARAREPRPAACPRGAVGKG
jgi:exosortase D (VPLPA-CTERM-specific)